MNTFTANGFKVSLDNCGICNSELKTRIPGTNNLSTRYVCLKCSKHVFGHDFYIREYEFYIREDEFSFLKIKHKNYTFSYNVSDSIIWKDNNKIFEGEPSPILDFTDIKNLDNQIEKIIKYKNFI